MLSEETFIHFAMKNYDNHHCKTLEEFNEDLNKVVHIKKLLNRILSGEEINHRLILNHLIIFYNVFKSDAATSILFFKMEQDKWLLLNTFLTYLNYSPIYIKELGISLYDMGTNKKILDELERI
jgi:hypothetical protein